MARPTATPFDEFTSFASLITAARRAARGHASSREVASFLVDIESQVLALQRELHTGIYAPSPWRTFRIRDPKPRTISAAAFRDRVVHHALCAAIEPVLSHDALATSFACRVGGGSLRALHAVQRLSRRHTYALKLDIRHFFETMDHAVLRRLLWRRIDDPRTRWLLDVFIEAGAPGSAPGTGLPIGNLTSQHFANFYLGPLDRHIQRGLGAAGVVRYMDDIIVFADSPDTLWAMERSIDQFVDCRLHVALKHEATRVMPIRDGIPILGFRVWPSTIRFDPARKRRWIRKMNRMARSLDSEAEFVEHATRVVASLVGWSMHGNTHAFRQSWVMRHGISD